MSAALAVLRRCVAAVRRRVARRVRRRALRADDHSQCRSFTVTADATPPIVLSDRRWKLELDYPENDGRVRVSLVDDRVSHFRIEGIDFVGKFWTTADYKRACLGGIASRPALRRPST